MLKNIAFTLALAILAIPTTQAQVYTFIGLDESQPHKWNEDDNWDRGFVPSSGDTVIIDGDSVSITTIDPELYSLELSNGAVLLNERQITISNIDTFGIKMDSSVLRNQGAIYVEGAGDTSIHHGMIVEGNSYLYNDSLINIQEPIGTGLYLRSSSELVNTGVIISNSKQSHGIEVSQSTLRNNGPLYVESAGAAPNAGLFVTLSSMVYNDSLVHVENSLGKGVESKFGAEVYNHGVIHSKAQRHALFNRAHFENFDSIYLNSTQQNPLRLEQASSFTNHTQGVIDCHGRRGVYLINSSPLINNGTLRMKGSSYLLFIRTNAEVINNGLLQLITLPPSSISARIRIESDGSLLNSANGVIQVTNDDNSDFLDVHLGGFFDCQGTLEMNFGNP